jgi:photosystem II stability/assembly factor-like uncharacterized protein
MKRYATLFAALLFSSLLNAQTYLQRSVMQGGTGKKKVTFWDVQTAFNDYWSNREISDSESENAEEGGYQQFKRWEWFMKQRTYPSGEFPSPDILFQQYQVYKQQYANAKGISSQAANWVFKGPGVVPGNGGGAGRINCITFDPTNSNTLWIGAACGGVWKSTNGGVSWSSNTDLLPALSVSDIVINPINTQIMYIATGDKFGIYVQYETWGHYSAGILKSTDGGATWNPTGMTSTLANNIIIQRLVMDPTNTNTLYAATFQGIYKTTDGGTTWTNIRSGYFYDIELNPTNPAILYAGDNVGFQLSTNSGATWNYISGVSSTGRTSIAVTPASPASVYCWCEGTNLYYSSNSGNTFTTKTNPSGTCTPYGYYDMVIEVSPTNVNTLFAGGLDVAKSTDGGTTWTAVSNWSAWPATNYVHADQKNMKFFPGSGTSLVTVNDGGIFKTTNTGSTWSDLSSGICNKEYYRMSSSQQNSYYMVAGAQDNGTDKITGLNTATQIMGADGEDCLIDFMNDQVVFASSQGGNFSRSTNGGASFTGISTTGCDWTSPLVQDPNNNQVIYMGSTRVNKSTNNGVSFASISPVLDGTCIYSIEVSPSNGQYIYAATFGTLWKTTNGGGTWSNVTGTLPVGSAAISGVAISNTNPNLVWVTFSGFSAGNKIYFSSNGGTSWSNISGTLQNIPVNCIEYQNNSNDLVYIGTDLGVYYTDASMNNWLPYNTGLPNVIIDDLEVYYPTSKLRAATYGRGIWESDLQVSTLQNLDASAFSVTYPPSSTCDSSFAPIVVVRNAGQTTLTSVDLYYSMDGAPYQMINYTGSLVSFATANITLPNYNLGSGAHTLKAYTTNPNTSTDQNNNNDTTTYAFSILTVPSGAAPPLVEGFVANVFPPANWQLENSSNLLSRSNTVGGYSSSTESMKADFYGISSGDDKLITPYINFTNAIPPIRMYFDVAYAPYNSTYLDTLFVDVYDDCSGSGPVLYTKGYTTLATAPATTNIFVPTATQWRTDTINLDAYAGGSAKRFRFIAKSGYGNELYLDNINITSGLTGTGLLNSELTVSVYPNPASGKVTLSLGGAGNGPVKIMVYALTGEKMRELEVVPVNGLARTDLDLAAFSPGIYFVQVISEKGYVTRRFVKQ